MNAVRFLVLDLFSLKDGSRIRLAVSEEREEWGEWCMVVVQNGPGGDGLFPFWQRHTSMDPESIIEDYNLGKFELVSEVVVTVPFSCEHVRAMPAGAPVFVHDMQPCCNTLAESVFGAAVVV